MFKHFPFIHNHGDFVHLDALREWFRGVPSLDTFLKYKNDKAIVKDMHFTDELTSVDYIDTNDDKEKNEVFCKYLISDVFDADDTTQFKKVDKIRLQLDDNGEKWLAVRQKDTGQFREEAIRSNVPIAYDATDNFKTSNHVVHFGVNELGVIIYNDENLQKSKQYYFQNIPFAYDVTDTGFWSQANKSFYVGFNENGVTIFDNNTKEKLKEYNYKDTLSVQEIELTDCDPFSSITGRNVDNDIGDLSLSKEVNFHGLKIGDTIVNGQLMYTITGNLKVKAGQFVELMLTPGSMGSSKFARNVYPKMVQCSNNQGLITSITKSSSYPLDNTSPTYITIFNPSTRDVAIQYLHFTF